VTDAHREGLVILGAPRSGTTLLRRLIDAHPEIACPPETYLLRACALFLQNERTGAGVDVGVLSGLAHAGFPANEVIAGLREFAFGFHRRHAERAGKRRWAEKTAFDAFHVPEVERLCGDHVHFVCLTRHALDVAVSIDEFSSRTGSHMLEIHEYVQREKRPLDAFTKLWVDVNTKLLDLVERRPDAAIHVRYEDLVADPDKELRRILDFAGETWDEGIVERALGAPAEAGLGDWKTWSKKGVESAAVGRWSSLPPLVAGRLGEIANDLLVRLGYDAVRVREEPDEDEARRRYEFAMMLAARKTESEG